MKPIWMITTFLALCVYLAGELRVQTGSWGYTLIALLFIVVVGFFTHVAQHTGVMAGMEVPDQLSVQDFLLYAAQHQVNLTNTSLYVASNRLYPAKSVYHALLDGKPALIIEAEDPHAPTV